MPDARILNPLEILYTPAVLSEIKKVPEVKQNLTEFINLNASDTRFSTQDVTNHTKCDDNEIAQNIGKIKITLLHDILANGISENLVGKYVSYTWQNATYKVEAEALTNLQLFQWPNLEFKRQNSESDFAPSVNHYQFMMLGLNTTGLILPVYNDKWQLNLVTFKHKLGSTLLEAYSSYHYHYVKVLNALEELIVSFDPLNNYWLELYQKLYGIQEFRWNMIQHRIKL